MSHYRLYFFSPHDGHIARFTEFEAENDGAAVAIASQSIGKEPLELWSGGRKVQRLDAVREVQPALDRAGLPPRGSRGSV